MGNFNGHPFSFADGINNRNEILALYQDDRSQTRTAIISGGQVRDIGSPANSEGTLGNAINDRGTVLGSFYMRDSHDAQVKHLFIYSNGQFHDLGLSEAQDDRIWAGINSRGQMVGWQRDPVKATYFAITNFGRQAEDLNSQIDLQSGFYLYQATGINDRGQISAIALDANSTIEGVILNPVRKCKEMR